MLYGQQHFFVHRTPKFSLIGVVLRAENFKSAENQLSARRTQKNPKNLGLLIVIFFFWVYALEEVTIHFF